MDKATVTSKLNALFDEFWNWRLEEFPEFATQAGFHNADDKLESYEIGSFQKRNEKCVEFLDAANSLLENVNLLQPQEITYLEEFISDLDTYVKGFQHKPFLHPINCMEGPQIDFENLISWMTFETEKDYRKLIARFISFPRQVDDIIAIMKIGMKENRTNHSSSMNSVIPSFQRLQVPAAEMPHYKPFLQISDKLSANIAEKLRFEALEVLETHFKPALLKLQHFIEEEYMLSLRPDIGISSLPNGKEFYQACLNYHLNLPMTPEEVHSIGLKEVSRIETEMQRIIKSLGLNLSNKEFAESLRKDEKFAFSSPDELLAEYKKISDIISGKIGELFSKIPEAKMNIATMLGGNPNSPAAIYLAGSYDGVRPGYVYINTASYKQQLKYEVVTLALHEGVPGHHFQMAYQMELKDLPIFLRIIEDRRYFDAPAKFSMKTAYMEGWGLYCEKLGYDLGMYDDPHTEYGHLSLEMLRACRLVVDPGMHVLGWTRDMAVNFMLKHTACSQHDIEREVDRYISLPGQACAYKIGQLKISELREKATRDLGDKFDIKEFHEVVLNNCGPLHLLEKRVNEYIASAK